MQSRSWTVAAIGLAIAALPVSSAAAPVAGEVTIAGEVTASRARWARGGRDIVTESVVRTAEGEVHVRQLGGTVDGVGMWVSHQPPLLAAGDRVTLRAVRGHDLSGRARLTVSAVDQLAPSRTGGDRVVRGDFVRTLNGTGAALYWDSNCVFLSYAAEGTPDIEGERELEIMDEVFETWRSETQFCSYMTFELEGVREGEVGLDDVNLVKFRHDEWCRPATDDEPSECYSPDAAGLTTLYYVDDTSSDDNGKIFDADIEINGVHFAISADGVSGGDGDCLSDLANTFTHEVGHLVGLDHTCWNGLGGQPVDDAGDPVPACSGALPVGASEATMFAFQDCGETKKITPEVDDVAGVCRIYDLNEDPGECRRPSGERARCCTVAGGREERGPGPSLVMLGFAALLLLRRRR